MQYSFLLKRVSDTCLVLKQRGLLNVFKIIWNQIQDRDFDKKYHVNTGHSEDPRNYLKNNSVLHSTLYAPTRARSFKKLLSIVKPDYSGRFIDYGCGKGRVLILAAEAGFNHLLGIEFVTKWAEMSKQNFNQTKQVAKTCDILNIDVLQYCPSVEDPFFYFYDPFDDQVLLPCLKAIKESFSKKNRNGHVVIHNNVRSDWSAVIAVLSELQTTMFEISGERFLVFQFNE